MALIKLPPTNVPSGTIYHDIAAIVTAVIALLKAFGVI